MYVHGFHFRLLSAPESGEQRDYLESRDSDHHACSRDFQKDETDYREWCNVEKDEATSHCLPLSNKNDREAQNPNITDPLLAHELLVPYNRMPRPRIFSVNEKDGEYIVTVLPRRPPSPVRHVLPERFDLCSRTEELLKRQSIVKARRYLREIKDRISQGIKQVSNADVDSDLIICTLVLRALCEQVILTMTGTNTRIDIRTFVNMAIIWALYDLEILDPFTLNEQEYAMSIELGLFDNGPRSESREAVAPSKLGRSLFEVHRPKFNPHILTHLHRCLPWPLVGPTHQRGVVKFYPTVRERIDESLSDPRRVKSAYVPDLTCFHNREVLDTPYMPYENKSMSSREQERIDHEQNGEVFVNFIQGSKEARK